MTFNDCGKIWEDVGILKQSLAAVDDKMTTLVQKNEVVITQEFDALNCHQDKQRKETERDIQKIRKEMNDVKENLSAVTKDGFQEVVNVGSYNDHGSLHRFTRGFEKTKEYYQHLETETTSLVERQKKSHEMEKKSSVFYHLHSALSNKSPDIRIAETPSSLRLVGNETQEKTNRVFNDHDSFHHRNESVGSQSNNKTERKFVDDRDSDDDSESEEDEEYATFKKYFFDDFNCIKKDVREKFKSFSWMQGEYGVNSDLPCFYVTVTGGRQREENVLKKEIDKEFGWEASNYFKFFPEPNKKPEFRLMSNLQVVEKTADNNNNRRSNGTLTMFGHRHGRHIALSCSHVACISDRRQHQAAFYLDRDREEIRDILKAKGIDGLNRENEYWYRASEANSLKLDRFLGYSFDEHTDIMAIALKKDEKLCCTRDEIDVPRDWKRIWNTTLPRLVRRGGAEVKKYLGDEIGTIVDIHYGYNCNGTELFADAIKVDCKDVFLKDGDSGVLVYVYDRRTDKNLAIGYGVSQVHTNSFLCFRLDKALKAMMMEGCGCFKTCKGCDKS